MIFKLIYGNGYQVDLEGHANVSESFTTKTDKDHYGVLQIHLEDPSVEADMFTGSGGDSSLYISICYLDEARSIGDVVIKNNFPHCKTETEYDSDTLDAILEIGGNRYKCNRSAAATIDYFFTAYDHCLVERTTCKKDIVTF